MSNRPACNRDCASATKLASIHNSVAILEFRPDGSILTANKRFLSLFNFRIADLYGGHSKSFWNLTDANAQEQDYLWAKVRNGENHLGVYRCCTMEGRSITVMVNFCPQLDASGKLVSVLALMLGVTELADDLMQRAIQEESNNPAQAASKETGSAEAAKAEFLASMSHELRTPLNAIIGFSDLIEKQLFGPLGDEKYLEYAHAIHQSGHALLEFVDAVLALSKVGAGKMEIHEKIFAADYLIGYCLDLAGKAAESRIAVTPAATDNLLIRGDFRLLAQALLNIISNALKFTPEDGPIAVTTRKSEGGLAIEVSDTGMGMSPDDIQRALSPYGRIQAKITGSKRGSGFGLSICRSFMELHGGDMEIASALGLGTRVSLSLPSSRVAATFEEATAL